MNQFYSYINEITGLSQSTLSKLFLTLFIIITLFLLRMLTSKILLKRDLDYKTRYLWQRAISILFSIIGLVLVSSIWTSAIREFGAFLGLIAAGVAIALKDPLTNLAGWLFIVFRKPFTLGDRIQIGENTGDIIDIRLFQFTILEIGNWVNADQSTGRIIHIPNGKVFIESQANYSTGFEYIWNEMPVLITFESNWKKAKDILEEVINKYSENVDVKVQKELHEASKKYLIHYKHLTPIVYTSVREHGVELTIRYLCNPRTRRGSENQIWEAILKRFAKEKDIDFAYPTTRFYKNETN